MKICIGLCLYCWHAWNVSVLMEWSGRGYVLGAYMTCKVDVKFSRNELYACAWCMPATDSWHRLHCFSAVQFSTSFEMSTWKSQQTEACLFFTSHQLVVQIQPK